MSKVILPIVDGASSMEKGVLLNGEGVLPKGEGVLPLVEGNLPSEEGVLPIVRDVLLNQQSDLLEGECFLLIVGRILPLTEAFLTTELALQ